MPQCHVTFAPVLTMGPVLISPTRAPCTVCPSFAKDANLLYSHSLHILEARRQTDTHVSEWNYSRSGVWELLISLAKSPTHRLQRRGWIIIPRYKWQTVFPPVTHKETHRPTKCLKIAVPCYITQHVEICSRPCFVDGHAVIHTLSFVGTWRMRIWFLESEVDIALVTSQ